MKKVFIVASFMLFNFVYSQAIPTEEFEKVYYNLSVTKEGSYLECGCVTRIVYNYDSVSGDILLELKDYYYLFKKAGKTKKSKTSYGYEFEYTDYVSDNGTSIVVQKFINETQGVRFILSPTESIRIY